MSGLLESRLTLRIKHAYKEHARAYRTANRESVKQQQNYIFIAFKDGTFLCQQFGTNLLKSTVEPGYMSPSDIWSTSDDFHHVVKLKKTKNFANMDTHLKIALKHTHERIKHILRRRMSPKLYQSVSVKGKKKSYGMFLVDATLKFTTAETGQQTL